MHARTTHSYIAQSMDDIRYCLTEAAADLSPFSILVQETYPLDYGQLTLAILGESHAWSIAHNTATLSEICACTDISHITSAVHNTHLKILPHTKHHNAHFEYSLETTFCSKTDWQHKADVFLSDATAATMSMQYQFPQGENDPIPPITAVQAIVEQTSVAIATLHTYPNEAQCVITRSQIRLL